MRKIQTKSGVCTLGLFFLSAATISLSTTCARAENTNLEQQINALQQENAALRDQLQHQGEAIQALSKKVDQLESAKTENSSPSQNEAPAKSGINLGRVDVSGEGGVAFFNTGREGFAPNSEFRIDEFRLFAEAPVWNEVYFFGEADFATRENTDLNVKVGELYLDFQDASQLWGRDDQFNIRAGRLNIPFGEEYMTRYAIDDPLISHSLSDLWGFDPGIEAYGSLGKFNYVVAVQNGGGNGVRDYDGDKSVAGRVGYDPNSHLHFSISGMRTGDVNVQNDSTSAEWFGTGFFHSIGSTATTTFHANLVEGDVTTRWKSGHVSGFGGYARYNDNDPAGSNGRDIFYYSVEAMQQLPQHFYAAARFSEIFAAGGYPIIGFGNPSDYFSNPTTTELWRLSLGIGYRFNDHLVIKTEYSFERGNEYGGDSRNHEDFFGTEAAFKF